MRVFAELLLVTRVTAFRGVRDSRRSAIETEIILYTLGMTFGDMLRWHCLCFRKIRNLNL